MKQRNYTRWRQIDDGLLEADILGSRFTIIADTLEGSVMFDGDELTPDEARMYGVRLIEGAARADGARAVRATPEV